MNSSLYLSLFSVKNLLITFSTAAFCVCTPAMHAQTPTAPAYRIQQLTVPANPELAIFSYGYSINNAGDVVGDYSEGSGNRATLWTSGTMFLLGAPAGASSSEANGINDAGQIVGDASGFRAWTWSSGTMSTIGSVGSTNYARGINNAGTIVGSIDTKGFTYTASGTYTELAPFEGASMTSGFGINASGQVVGSSFLSKVGDARATLWTNGVATNLGTLGVADGFFRPETWGRAINDAGDVVGLAKPALGQERAFLYSNGTMTNLGLLSGANDEDRSDAMGINNQGQVVGFASVQGRTSGFLYSGGVMTELSALLPEDSGLFDITGEDINEWGQITGHARTATNQRHAILMNPVNALTFTSQDGKTRDTRFIGGMEYDTFTETTNSDGLGTTVELLDGTVGSRGRMTYGLNRHVVMTFVESGATGLASDVVSLTGTEGDLFVLSLSYDEALAISLYGSELEVDLGWFDEGVWKLAVDGNSSGSAHKILGAYNPLTDFWLGAYGVDTETNTVWAVINHNSEFAAIPEPGTYVLLGLGLLAVGNAAFRRQRQQAQI